MAKESQSIDRSSTDLTPVLGLRWIIAYRVCLLGVALLATSVCTFFYGWNCAEEVGFLYIPIAVLFSVSALSALWIRFLPVGWGFSYLQLLFDVIIVSGIVYASGGPGSPFLFLYLPIIMSAAIFVSRAAALIFAVVSGLSYSALAWAMMEGSLPVADGSEIVPVPPGGLLLQCVGLFSAMILISVATSFLIKKLRASYLVAEQTRKDLSDLSQRQKRLFDGLPEGVLTTNLNGSIMSCNKAAAALFRVIEEDVLGCSLTDFPSKLNGAIEGDFISDHGTHEISLNFEDDEEARKITYNSRPVTDEEGQQTGSMFVFQDVTRLRSVEEQLAMQERMAKLLSDCKAPEVSPTRIPDFVGESAVMQKVFGLIDRVAPSEATVLISGESGTGKELVAKAIHLGSSRASSPFVPVNCGAIPDTLIESELFGHKKGSFTGADSDHVGLFRQANGGTIFLDEIGELPLLTQAKLLRALQEKCVRPVGSEITVPVNVRILAASNKKLREEVKKEKFREDLFYRLNVVGIKIPPLRDRKDDIPLLVNSILKRLVDSETIPIVTPATMKILMKHDYPGNVRELENILERAFVFGGEVILPEHLPDVLKDSDRNEEIKTDSCTETQIIINNDMVFPVELDVFLEDIEKKYLKLALVKTNGAKKKAAKLLGINFRSFRYRLQKFGLNEDSDA